MKRNFFTVTLLVAVAALAVVAVRQNQQIKELKEKPAVMAVAPSKPAPPPVEATPAPVPEPSAAPVPVGGLPAGPTGGSTSNFLAGLAGMMKDPQMKEVIRAQQKMALGKMYGALFKNLNLSTDQTEALRNLLLERQMALTEAGMAMMSGNAPDRKLAIEQAKSIKDNYDKQIEEMLGPTDYAVFHQFEDTQPERMQLQMFKETLAPTEMLNDQQEAMLIAAMYDERKALPATALVNNKTPDPSQLTEAGIAETLQQLDQLQQRYAERAATVLGPAQMQQFQKFQEQWHNMQVAGLRMAARMFGPAATPAAPAGQ